MRYLTNDEINFITKDIKYQKLEVKNILKAKIKVYKLTKTDLSKLKKTFQKLFERDKKLQQRENFRIFKI